MKRTMVVVGLMAMVSVMSLQAWAQGPHNRGQGGSAVTQEQRQQFLKDTEATRQAIWDKEAQLRDLLASPESDPTAIGKLEKEIYQLRTQIRDKASASGLCPMGGRKGGRGCGNGYGYGRGMACGMCW